MFTVDGMEWDFPCDIERVSEMAASEISGLLLNKNYFNDVIGTFLQYSITLVVPFGSEDEYTNLYNILTDPVDAHAFVLPFNAGVINITGRVSNISDVYYRLPGGKAHWRGIKFNVIANSPYRTHTVGEAITRGTSPLPDIGGATEGDVYQYDGTSWVAADFQNADDTAY